MVITFTKKGKGWYTTEHKQSVKLLGEGKSKLLKDIENININMVPKDYDRVYFNKLSNIYMYDRGDIVRLTNVVAYNIEDGEFKKVCLNCGKVKDLSEFMQRGRDMGTIANRTLRQDYPYCTDCRAIKKKQKD